MAQSPAQTAMGIEPGASLGPGHRIEVADRRERDELLRRFEDRLRIRHDLSRRLVSYQANKTQPGLRWFKYKEGFSAILARQALAASDGPVLDPFAGLCTTVLVAAGGRRPATGIEIMPVGVRAAQAIAAVGAGKGQDAVGSAAMALLDAVKAPREPDAVHRFPHVPITKQAFSNATEDAIARARAFLGGVEDPVARLILDVACMSVLEEVSYTRKDGQYLRWDSRSGRPLRGAMHKGPIPSFADALGNRLHEVRQDAPGVRACFGGRPPRIVQGSALHELPRLPSDSVGLTVTSPPYANRYDYTRTYALELAWLGYDRAAFGDLRQALISATVENRPKDEFFGSGYGNPDSLNRARAAIASQAALGEVLDALESRRGELSNPHVIRLVRNYFREMAVVIAELARVTKPGGRVVMVNDNVQYHGEEVPVDLILSDIAERCGFVCEEIGVLPRGKGNASQQMGRFGRREIRKCVYHWRRGEAAVA